MSLSTWKNIKMSSDRTHHVIDGMPLYKKRFLSVMSFHDPGLAAVRDVNYSWHINISGVSVYSHVFEKTFGFYENLAAVVDKNGWFHIIPDGTAAYDKIYNWCGNFQNGFAVIRASGGYCHISYDGKPICGRRFLYAGDFREERAVVRLPDGLCVHINGLGVFAYDFRYQDLGVYHKGYACACDNRGWMHIDRKGIPIYERRFSSLEPFYNERALAEDFNGDIVVINEHGENIEVITSKKYSQCDNYIEKMHGDFHSLSADMVGYWKTYTLAVAVKLSAPEKFPILKCKVGETLKIPEDNARIFLRALAELDVVQERNGMWELTAKGGLLRKDHPYSLAAAARNWSELAEDGAEQWLHALTKKTNMDIFSKNSNNPEKLKNMHVMLASYAMHDYAKLSDILPLNKMVKLIDAGGGNGATAHLIVNANKDITVVIFDRPEVLALLNTDNKNIPRIIFHGGDIFQPWNINGDAVLLARVIHDWDDERAMLILRNAHDALTPGGRIFIVELLPQKEYEAGICSFHLLTVGGGKERMLDEYRQMMKNAGFLFLDSRALGGGIFVLMGEKT